MNKPKKIIVGTDLSDPSKAALDAARFYAETFGSELILVSAFDATPFVAPSVIPGPTDLLESASKEVEMNIRGSLQELQTTSLRGLNVKVLAARHPSPGDALVDIADEEHADLIIVASHGRTGLKRILLGSVAERVCRMAKCAVLVVRA